MTTEGQPIVQATAFSEDGKTRLSVDIEEGSTILALDDAVTGEPHGSIVLGVEEWLRLTGKLGLEPYT